MEQYSRLMSKIEEQEERLENAEAGRMQWQIMNVKTTVNASKLVLDIQMKSGSLSLLVLSCNGDEISLKISCDGGTSALKGVNCYASLASLNSGGYRLEIDISAISAVNAILVFVAPRLEIIGVNQISL